MEQSAPPHRVPAVLAALSMLSGIVVGDGGADWATLLSVGTLLTCLILARRSGFASRSDLFIVVLSFTAGLWVSNRGVSETGSSTLVEVDGRLLSTPERHEVPHTATISRTSGDYTTADVHIEAPAGLSGRSVLLVIPGHAPSLTADMRVRLIGRLEPIPPPANPGQSASRHRLKISVRDAGAVRVLDDSDWQPLRERVRSGIAATLRQRLPHPQSALAEALTLGRRDRVPQEVLDAFQSTGTGHLLAISGTHVGIVSGLVLLLASRLTRSVTVRVLAVVVCVLLYGMLVETRSSVVRSVLFASLAAVGVAGGRRVEPFALISVAAITVMAGDPQAVYEPGTQLSFTAVTAILVAGRLGLIARLTPPSLRVEDAGLARRVTRRVVEYLLWATVIWAAVMPLTWLHFRTVTVWAPLMTVLLLPVVSFAMSALYAVTAADLWVPMPAWMWLPARWPLSLLLWSVRTAAEQDALNWTLGSPPAWSVAVLYAALVAAAVARPPVSDWLRRGVLAWIAAACILALLPGGRPAMRVTCLSVGHGLCTVVQTASGRTVLVDVGSMSDADRTALRVGTALREIGVDAVQTVFLSHADRDHYGSLRSLLRDVAVGEVVIHPSFRDDPPPPLLELLEEIEERRVPLRYAAAGDRFDYGSVRATVMHPEAGGRYESDNEESLVVLLEAAGRTVLSTGDIEGAGLDWMMSLPETHADVLLAPHHGAVDANTPTFAKWSTPHVVVCSSGFDRAAFLQSVYEDATVFQTRSDGAVEVAVGHDGRVVVTGFRSKRRFTLPSP